MKKKSVIVLSLCALFLFFKYIAQLFPSLISSQLMQSHGYNGVMLAVMASSYYYSYTIMQMVAGFLVDRFAVRIPMFLAILMISLMIFLFTHTNNFYVMCISRVMMGVGASFATVLYMKCAARYTTAKTFGLISSLLATATMLGAACGSSTVALLFQKFGWQEGLNLIAVAGLIMAFAVLIFQKSEVNEHIESQMYMRFSNIKEIVAKKDNWLLLLYSGLTFSPVAVLGGLWGAPFLIIKYAITATEASFFLSIMFVGHAIGSPFWALLSAKLNRKKELMHVANVVSLLAILGIIYGNFSYSSSLVLFFTFGFSVGCFMLSFELCREINALYIMGLSVAFINSGEGLVGSFIEPFIGQLLDVSSVGSAFTLINYQKALVVLPCCFLLSSFVLIFIQRKEMAVTFKKYVNEYARA
ncbi:MAG: MFS transporter [Gammaproteobacteria bacterium]